MGVVHFGKNYKVLGENKLKKDILVPFTVAQHEVGHKGSTVVRKVG